MTFPKNRSTSMRKVHVRVPTGKTVHYRRRKKGECHSCGITGVRLQAVSSRQSVNKSQKTPNRKFGGALSSAAASRIIVLATRVKEGAMQLSEIDVRLLPYVKRMLGKKN